MIKDGWYRCEYCGQKFFPIERDTLVKRLPVKCKNRYCKKINMINIEPEVKAQAVN